MATPPFQYGPTTNPATQTYPLNPGNAAPALIVWLFLVTQPDFLNYLTDPKSRSTPVPVDQIAYYTNLEPSAVESILNIFINASQERQSSFSDVSNAFQDLCAKNNQIYLPGQCPHDAGPMLWLAQSGAHVDPAAQKLGPLPKLTRDK